MLTTIGVVLATIAISFVGFVLLLKLGIRWYFTRMVKAAQTMAASHQGMVARITLQLRKTNFSDPRVHAVMQQLKALGYVSAGRYEVDEMPTLKMWAGTHPKNGTLALVLELNERLHGTDLIRFYDNGTVLGAGTNPVYHADRYPSHIQYRQFPPGTPMQEVAQWLAARPMQAGQLVATHENLRQLNAKMYAELMDYQLSLPTLGLPAWKDMVLKDAKSLGATLPEMTEQQWQAGYDAHLLSMAEATETAMKDHVLRSGAVSALEWDHIQYELVYVYERLSAEDVAERALRRSEWTADEPRVEALLQQKLPHPALFEAIQQLLPPDQRFRLLTEVNQPVAARVYRPVQIAESSF